MKNIKVLTQDEVSDPEIRAMLQAFYSRSPMPIQERLQSLNGDEKEIKEDKIRSAIKKYYVDYGHASIGDCGDTTVFIEGVSMLAAKAIQDYPLYRGQECSTRYMDFSQAPFLIPENLPNHLAAEYQKIVEVWRGLYLRSLQTLITYAKEHYPESSVLSYRIPAERRASAYEATIKAIVFDYARGLLPCGASTSLSFHGSMRSLQDNFTRLQRHPLVEVRKVADQCLLELWKNYPNSFREPTVGLEPTTSRFEFYDSESLPNQTVSDVSWAASMLALSHLSTEDQGLRTNKAAKLIHLDFLGKLDFGSYRDLQRHRNGVILQPLVEPEQASDYYMQAYYEADPELFDAATTLFSRLKYLDGSPEQKQYVCPMMTMVPIRGHWSLDQLRYVTRLRTKTSVHPTLRKFMQDLASRATVAWIANVPATVADVPLRVSDVIDRSENYQSSDRGEQTIKEKPSA